MMMTTLLDDDGDDGDDDDDDDDDKYGEVIQRGKSANKGLCASAIPYLHHSNIHQYAPLEYALCNMFTICPLLDTIVHSSVFECAPYTITLCNFLT